MDGAKAVPRLSGHLADTKLPKYRKRPASECDLVGVVVGADDLVGALKQPGLRFLEPIGLLADVRDRSGVDGPAGKNPDGLAAARCAVGPIALGFGVGGVFGKHVAVGLDGHDPFPVTGVRWCRGDLVLLTAVAVEPRSRETLVWCAAVRRDEDEPRIVRWPLQRVAECDAEEVERLDLLAVDELIVVRGEDPAVRSRAGSPTRR